MNRVAKFEKVSFEQYIQDCYKLGVPFAEDEEYMRKQWEAIKLPTRATSGSAGYDFYLPMKLEFTEVPFVFPTGIRCKIGTGWFLGIVPKSGLGFKYNMTLENTFAVVDEDYYYSDNEGHIMIKSKAAKPFWLAAGQKVVQGIFLPFGITVDDAADGVRNGGFGSTGA